MLPTVQLDIDKIIQVLKDAPLCANSFMRSAAVDKEHLERMCPISALLTAAEVPNMMLWDDSTMGPNNFLNKYEPLLYCEYGLTRDACFKIIRAVDRWGFASSEPGHEPVGDLTRINSFATGLVLGVVHD